MSPSARATRSMTCPSLVEGNPVSRLFMRSWAWARSSTTCVSSCAPRCSSCWRVAAASWSASRRVEDGWLRPAVPVDRCVVEVRPELPHRVLGVLAHEHLTAEPDDRLVGAAVAVVLEPVAVQRDHLLGVFLGPEDVVGEEAVAVVGGLLGDL